MHFCFIFQKKVPPEKLVIVILIVLPPYVLQIAFAEFHSTTLLDNHVCVFMSFQKIIIMIFNKFLGAYSNGNQHQNAECAQNFEW